MPGNIDPIYTKVGAIDWTGNITSAAADYDGTGANNVLAFTADATNGSYVHRIRFKAAGTNVATVMRIYINNGSTNGTAANNVLHGEISLPAITSIATAATVDMDYPLNIVLPPGYRIYVGLGTAVSAGWNCSTIAGDY